MQNGKEEELNAWTELGIQFFDSPFIPSIISILFSREAILDLNVTHKFSI